MADIEVAALVSGPPDMAGVGSHLLGRPVLTLSVYMECFVGVVQGYVVQGGSMLCGILSLIDSRFK